MIKRIVVVLLLSIIFTGCKNAPDHEKCIAYTVTIQQPLQKNINLFSDYLKVMSVIITEEQANGWQYADSNLIDSLEFYDSMLVSSVEQHISKLKLLNEIDYDLKLKQETLDYLFLFKPTLKESTQIMKSLCSGGIKTFDRKKFNVLKLNIAKMSASQNNLNDHLFQFQRKYKITDEELKKHGLPGFVD